MYRVFGLALGVSDTTRRRERVGVEGPLFSSLRFPGMVEVQVRFRCCGRLSPKISNDIISVSLTTSINQGLKYSVLMPRGAVKDTSKKKIATKKKASTIECDLCGKTRSIQGLTRHQVSCRVEQQLIAEKRTLGTAKSHEPPPSKRRRTDSLIEPRMIQNHGHGTDANVPEVRGFNYTFFSLFLLTSIMRRVPITISMWR